MPSVSRQQTLTSNLPVPFEPAVSLFHIPTAKSPSTAQSTGADASRALVIPAVFFSKGTLNRLSFGHGVHHFLETQLDVSRLNEIHHHLWMVGKPAPGRPLHHHIIAGRKIVCTEQADLHLLWEDSRLFVKPCPDYLLSYDFWERHICGNEDLWETALGMLHSYAWLLQDKSDWRLAQSEGILSESISWERWTMFVASLCQEIDTKKLRRNPRFIYGNLRLTRIQHIYRLFSRSKGCHAFINGYLNPYSSYRNFFVSNIAPVTAATIYLALILGAMQVGLSTDRLQGSNTFQGASIFVSILAIVGPLLCMVLLVSVVMGYVFIWNLQHAFKQRRAARLICDDKKSEA